MTADDVVLVRERLGDLAAELALTVTPDSLNELALHLADLLEAAR